MSGLLALLDDVAALTKLAAAQLDDVAAQAVKAGSKAAGVVIDDSAVTPKYVHGLPATRELPIVWKIAKGSLFNKMVILLPAALLLSSFAPWLIVPLLMVGGLYLCFEGAEKIWHYFRPHAENGPEPTSLDAAHLERERVAGAIKTDFILSAEIMTIALASISVDNIWLKGLALALVALAITVLVYGTVALLVKADDIGLKMASSGRLSLTRSMGRAIVRGMPSVMAFISAVGTVAMLWVGGSIIVHGLESLGWGGLGHAIQDLAGATARALPAAGGLVKWLITATLDGLFGLVVGILTMPVVGNVLAPLIDFVLRRETT
ncbi:MAG: DUF808 domain-containing protein [Hyphomicrobiaceae bacterium]